MAKDIQIVPPMIRYPGAKWRMANWVNENIPKHISYVEPYCGSAAIFFSKSPSKLETLNDIDDNIVNFMRVLRDTPNALIRAVRLTPLARAEYEYCRKAPPTDDPVERARRYYVIMMQGIAHSYANLSGWSHNTKQVYHGKHVNVWKRETGLFHAAKRLRNAQIECRDALEVIQKYDTPDAFFYIDPPYLEGLRTKSLYTHEMGEDDQHVTLLKALLNCQGKVMLCGYDNPLYDHYLPRWRKIQHSSRNNSGNKRQEVMWLSYEQDQLPIANDTVTYYNKTLI